MKDIVILFEANSRHSTPRMPLDVRQRFLNDPKDGGLYIDRKAVELLGKIERHLDAAALLESLGIPAQSGQQSRLFDHRRMQQIGERTDLVDRLVGQRDALLDPFT